MVINSPLVVSLEELGLSQYEARAYYTMLSKGPLSASDLAYYSDLPRTKVYPTLQKLQKKNLATASGTKPMMCMAIAPENAFDVIIQDQINRVNAMNSLVSSLKTLSEESHKNRGIEEMRYRRLTPANVPHEMGIMIDGARQSIMIMVDGVGTNLVRRCYPRIAAAGKRGVDIRIIVPPEEIDSKKPIVLPPSSHMRMSGGAVNYIMVDSSALLVVDATGKGEAFSTFGVMGDAAAATFEGCWGTATDCEPLLEMASSEAGEVYGAIKALGDSMDEVLHGVICGSRPDMAGILERKGIAVYSKSVSELIELADSALRVSCGGRAVMDVAGGAILAEGEGGGWQMAWALVFEAYLLSNGYIPRITLDGEEARVRFRND